MQIISLYLVFDSNQQLVMMCSDLGYIKDELNDKRDYYVGDFQIRYIEFVSGDILDKNSMLKNLIFIDTRHNI